MNTESSALSSFLLSSLQPTHTSTQGIPSMLPQCIVGTCIYHSLLSSTVQISELVCVFSFSSSTSLLLFPSLLSLAQFKCFSLCGYSLLSFLFLDSFLPPSFPSSLFFSLSFSFFPSFPSFLSFSLLFSSLPPSHSFPPSLISLSLLPSLLPNPSIKSYKLCGQQEYRRVCVSPCWFLSV